jgi:diguanylate cyclase (GGDEF)-like protein
VTASPGSDAELPGSFEAAALSREDAERAVRREVERTNIQRARQLGPILVLVHVVHVLVFRFAHITGGGSEEAAALWRERLVDAHAVAAIVTLALSLVTFRGPRAVASRGLPLVASFYLVHGAWVASIDQLVTPAMTPYVIVCVGVAVVVAWPRRVAAASYLLGYVALAVLCWHAQPDMARRVSLLLNGLTITAVGLGLSFYVSRTTTRRLRQHALIDAQHRALSRLAAHDALTDLPNRRVFSHALGEAVRAAEEGRAATVALLDLDHFKRVNDEHGHEVGDVALVAVATLLREHLRTDDVAARLGGEEFGVLLSGTDDERAASILDDLRARIAEAAIGESELHVTASIGFTQVRPGDGAEGREALRRADEALYAAKAAGRNRVLAG